MAQTAMNKHYYRLVLILLIISGISIFAFRVFTRHQSSDGALTEALKLCGGINQRTSFISCLKKKLGNSIATNGMESYMTALASRTIEVGDHCHDIAHVVGQIGALNKRPLTGCTAGLCEDGCYHGYLEAYIAQGGDELEAADRLCGSILNENSRIRWACFHGLGHGLASIKGDLHNALSMCYLLKEPEESKNCGAGVFMELFLSSSIGGAPLKLPEDIVSLCRQVGGLHQDTCFMSSGVYEYERSQSVEKAVSVCKRIPVGVIKECVMLLGSLLWNRKEDTQVVMKLCGSMEYSQSCVRGVVLELAMAGLFAEGVAVCRGTPSAFNRECFALLGEKTEYGYGKEKRQELCKTLDESSALACL